MESWNISNIFIEEVRIKMLSAVVYAQLKNCVCSEKLFILNSKTKKGQYKYFPFKMNVPLILKYIFGGGKHLRGWNILCLYKRNVLKEHSETIGLIIFPHQKGSLFVTHHNRCWFKKTGEKKGLHEIEQCGFVYSTLLRLLVQLHKWRILLEWETPKNIYS